MKGSCFVCHHSPNHDKEIIFPRREGTYLTGRCSSLETTRNTRVEHGRARSGYHNLKVQGVPSFLSESSAKVTNVSNREGRNRN